MIRPARSDRPTRRFHGSWRASSLVGLAASLAIAGTALAGWVGVGFGSGWAAVSTLGTTTVTASGFDGRVVLDWSPVPAPGGSEAVRYVVQRDGSNPNGNCPTATSPGTGLQCYDDGLFAGTYSYTVTAVFHSWTSVSAPVSVTLASGALSRLAVSAPDPMTAGVSANLTIQALDAHGVLVTSQTGAKCLTFAGPANSPNGTAPTYPPAGSCKDGYREATFVNGIATVPITLVAATLSATLQVTDAAGHTNGDETSVHVVAGAARTFSIPTPGAQTAGVPFSVSIAAADAYGNTATSFAGTKCLAFTGPLNSPAPVNRAPTYPAGGVTCPGRSAVTFTDGSAASVAITLYNPASTVLTATDWTGGAAGAAGSTGSFDVLPAGAASFVIANPGPQTAAVAFSVTITAMDGYGSVASGYTGAKCIALSGLENSPSGMAPVYPAVGGCSTGRAVTFANGVATIQVTTFRAGSTSLTAADGGVAGTSPSFQVFGSPTIAALQLTSSANTLIAGTQANLTVTGMDPYGNTSSYTGNQTLTFTGAPTVTGSPYVPTVTDSAGMARSFGTGETIAFTNGVASVSSGTHNGAAVLYAGGDNTFHVSDGTHTSGDITIVVTVHAMQVAAGGYHTCALLTYGGVECWGRNSNGQVGDGGTSQRELLPRAVPVRDVVSVVTGQFHTCALRSDHSVWCWGHNDNGQLGDGTTRDRTAPVQVANLTDVASIAAGRAHTCAIRTDGSAWCWGDNSSGQLGNNSIADQTVPVQVHGVGNVGNLSAASISAGGYHTCAVAGGTVACWGENSDGQVGDGTGVNRRYPVAVVGITTATRVSAGGYHTCAVLAGGLLDCWGYGVDGELGTGGTGSQDAPVPAGLTGATMVSAGAYHTCALSGTSPYCWGYNASGQVGDNTTTQRNSPTSLSGLSAATQIAAGGGLTDGLEHSVALAGGVVWTWGENTSGEIGDGSRADRHHPVAITLA